MLTVLLGWKLKVVVYPCLNLAHCCIVQIVLRFICAMLDVVRCNVLFLWEFKYFKTLGFCEVNKNVKTKDVNWKPVIGMLPKSMAQEHVHLHINLVNLSGESVRVCSKFQWLSLVSFFYHQRFCFRQRHWQAISPIAIDASVPCLYLCHIHALCSNG